MSNQEKEQQASAEQAPAKEAAAEATEETAVEASAEAEETPVEEVKEEPLKLNGLYGYKIGMSVTYDEDGNVIPVTLLKYDTHVVSQLKTKEKDGYSAVQVAFSAKRATRTTAAEKGHLKKTGFENGAYYVREVRQELPEGVQVGKPVSIDSFQKGDKIKVTATSKGHGFSGAVKRHGFAGGPASHGSGFHRRPGSIGNCEFPGRVMPGRKMPGHFGVETVTVKNINVVDVIPEENVILLKGSVPGAQNGLVKMVKE